MYLNTWEVDINFNTFFGAGRHNLINDRDFLGVSLKYLF